MYAHVFRTCVYSIHGQLVLLKEAHLCSNANVNVNFKGEVINTFVPHSKATLFSLLQELNVWAVCIRCESSALGFFFWDFCCFK